MYELKDNNTDRVLREILTTKDYDKFHYIKGNRPLNEAHVVELLHSFEELGNLTDREPLEIDEENGVLDGQHRLEVCKRLGWHFSYTIQPVNSIELTRARNLHRRNWVWQDFGYSYADLGEENYKQFMGLVELYKFPLKTMLAYCGYNGHNKDFRGGKLVIKDKARTLRQLTQLKEVTEILTDIRPNSALNMAFYYIFNSPVYDHKHMMLKFAKHQNMLQEWARVPDYMRNLEDIYNTNMSAENRVRLF